MSLFVQHGALYEPVTVVEVACSGLGRIEFMGGGMACYVLYRNTITAGSGEAERQICGRVYAPLEAIPEAIDLMTKALIESGRARAVEFARRVLM